MAKRLLFLVLCHLRSAWSGFGAREGSAVGALVDFNAKFLLFRAIGNDLPPRHAIGQVYENVKFILENEQNFQGVHKRWYVNRIVVKGEEQRIIELLKQHKADFVVDPVDLKEYAKARSRVEGFGQLDMLHSDQYRWTSS